jgi:SAM-dependent methyltransferase
MGKRNKVKPARAVQGSTNAELSRYECYEHAVQNPPALVPLLRAIHAGPCTKLGEDFCGSAALSRAWCAMVPRGRAMGVDLDPEAIEQARRSNGRSRAITLVQADVLKLPASVRSSRHDVIFVGNFSIGELHTRKKLVQYLRGVRARLSKGGVFVCDTYGGETAFARGSFKRVHEGPRGTRIHYTWQQRRADALTGMVENALHFRVERAGEIVQDLTDAFVYRWRLWSVPELRDAMSEAGLRATEVYEQLPDAVDADGRAHVMPVSGEELEGSFIVCVAGRA